MTMRLRVATAVVVLVVGLVVIAKVARPDPPTLSHIASLVADGPPSKRGAVAVIGMLARRPEQQGDATEWWFTLQEDSQGLRVHYQGLVPSTFKEGASVLVVGRMEGDTFAAERLAVRAEM
jgi:cytochrome c-type biogenesis protein CcmE